MAPSPQFYLSLFAGVGSLDLALRIAEPSARCVGYVEVEAAAAGILAARMADGSLDEAPVWSDVRTFPSRLYRDRRNVIRDFRPQWVYLENVPLFPTGYTAGDGIVSDEHGRNIAFLPDSGLFLETWPRWGSMRNGVVYERAAWEGMESWVSRQRACLECFVGEQQ